MVNRNNINVGLGNDPLTKPDITANRGHISRNLSSRNSNDNLLADDVIAQLANAHENRRARQVTEWERMFRGNVQRAA